MNNEIIRGMVIVAVMALATVITRFLPFLLFPSGKKTPKYITYLGTTLPYATIGLLVVYCLKELTFTAYPFGLAEILSIAVITVLHCLKKNSLLSIGAGTVLYMFLVQAVFS